jgi:hypothetical protein
MPAIRIKQTDLPEIKFLHRSFLSGVHSGSAPESHVMVGVASISLLVNATVLYLLGRYRDQGVHLRAT